MPEKNIKPQSDHTRCPVDTIHPQHAPVWMRVPAWRQLLRPVTVNRSSLWPRPHRYLLLPRLERGSRRFFPGPPHLPVPVLVFPLLPWLIPRRGVPVPVKRKKLWQKRPQGLRPRQQLPNLQPLRLPQAARRCRREPRVAGQRRGRPIHGAPEARSEHTESWSMETQNGFRQTPFMR